MPFLNQLSPSKPMQSLSPWHQRMSYRAAGGLVKIRTWLETAKYADGDTDTKKLSSPLITSCEIEKHTMRFDSAKKNWSKFNKDNSFPLSLPLRKGTISGHRLVRLELTVLARTFDHVKPRSKDKEGKWIFPKPTIYGGKLPFTSWIFPVFTPPLLQVLQLFNK